LYCGNSGTTIRLLTGILAGMHGVDAVLTGDSSLSRRPMDRIVQPLSQMGGDIEGSCPPLTIRGRPLSGTKYKSPVASAQVKSAVLLAGLTAQGATWVTEPSLSRDHTERMFEALGIELLREGDLSVGLLGGQRLGPLDFLVPGDISSAAFFMVAASILPGSKVTLSQVGINPTRTGVLDILRQAGASVTLDQEFDSDGEPVADITVASGGLKAFEICGPLVPRLIDEIPILAVLATQCEGVTVIRDASELRVKESDRIELVANGLNAMGAHVEPLQDGLKITGPSLLTGATIDATGDHRIAMSFAIAGMVAMGETRVTGAESISTSYPQFESDLAFVTGREMA
ncbi:MAG: 3-phosphoshikimate 1-carboxyvinyltransferase, partial [Chthonomonadaceae bacterium]|nr:3-phosphoshikimate 1-carboxyvinyltransferase [Chthonomonadaceae bacterium]